MKKCQKSGVKKSHHIKKVFNKSCPKFCRLGDNFSFEELSKMRILGPTNPSFEGSKEARGEKVIKSKMKIIKVVRNFENYVTIFFYFDEILKMRILQPKYASSEG